MFDTVSFNQLEIVRIHLHYIRPKLLPSSSSLVAPCSGKTSRNLTGKKILEGGSRRKLIHPSAGATEGSGGCRFPLPPRPAAAVSADLTLLHLLAWGEKTNSSGAQVVVVSSRVPCTRCWAPAASA
eukprot:530559-Hanusia_phi.AAC.2